MATIYSLWGSVKSPAASGLARSSTRACCRRQISSGAAQNLTFGTSLRNTDNVNPKAGKPSPPRTVGSRRNVYPSVSSVGHLKPISSPHNLTGRRFSHRDAAPKSPEPIIHDIFEKTTGTWQYVVADPSTMAAVIIDPVLDFDPATQIVSTQAADSLISLIMFWGYKVDMILETHAHADHLTASSYLQNRLTLQQAGHRPLIGIGKRIEQVQRLFGKRYGIPEDEYQNVFDKLFDDNEEFEVGSLKAKAIHLPGHTPDHLGYHIGRNVFCGDSIFHADIGTARCDFPGGSSTDLFASGQKLLALADEVKIWTGHDYPPEGRSTPVPWMTVRQHKQQNKHLKEGVSEQEFVALRDDRDAKLGEPRLLHQSLQMNIRAGRIPKATSSGPAMLHLPLKLKGVGLW